MVGGRVRVGVIIDRMVVSCSRVKIGAIVDGMVEDRV